MGKENISKKPSINRGFAVIPDRIAGFWRVKWPGRGGVSEDYYNLSWAKHHAHNLERERIEEIKRLRNIQTIFGI